MDSLPIPDAGFAMSTADVFDAEPWADIEVHHLIVCLSTGGTIEQAAAFLCKSGTEVRRKADEIGLTYRTKARASHVS